MTSNKQLLRKDVGILFNFNERQLFLSNFFTEFLSFFSEVGKFYGKCIKRLKKFITPFKAQNYGLLLTYALQALHTFLLYFLVDFFKITFKIIHERRVRKAAKVSVLQSSVYEINVLPTLRNGV